MYYQQSLHNNQTQQVLNIFCIKIIRMQGSGILQDDQLQRQEQQPKKTQNLHRINLSNKTVNQRYHVFEQLRKTHDSTLYLGIETNKRATRKLLIEFYDFQSIQNKQSFQAKQMIKRVTRLQQKLMKSLKSRHFPTCFDVCQTYKYKAIIFNHHSIQTLSQKVSKKVFSEHQAILTLKQIIKGLHELQQKNIVHFSLVPESIVCDAGTYMLTQFGFRNTIKQILSIQNTKTPPVLNHYIAPQINERKSFNLKAQVWTVGMLFFFMLFGQLPFNGNIQKLKNRDWITQAFTDKVMKDQVSGHTLQFFRKTLQIEPLNRMKFDEMVNHQIFKQYQARIPQKIVLNIDISKIKINQGIVENRFSLEKQKQSLMKELQVPYQLSASDLDITVMQTGDMRTLFDKFERLKKPMILNKIEGQYLDCLKAKWIYENVYGLVKQKSLLKQSERATIQFKYLVVTRCFYNISNIQKRLTDLLEQSKKDYENQQFLQDYANQIIRNIRILQSQVTKTWKKCSDQLFKKESQKKQIFFDTFKKIVYGQQQKLKARMLEGLQKTDYQKNQQIQYTIKYFQNNLQQKLQLLFAQKQAVYTAIKQAHQLIKHMEFYKQINEISFNQQNSEIEFTDLVQNIEEKSKNLIRQIDRKVQPQSKLLQFDFD